MTLLRCRFAKYAMGLKWIESEAYVRGNSDAVIALEVCCFHLGNPVWVLALSHFVGSQKQAIWLRSMKNGKQLDWLVDFPGHENWSIFSAAAEKHAIKVTLVKESKA